MATYVWVLRGVGQYMPPQQAGAGRTCRAPRCGDQVCATGILARAIAELGANPAAPCNPAGHSRFKVYILAEVPTQHDSLAEWSKALASGASP